MQLYAIWQQSHRHNVKMYLIKNPLANSRLLENANIFEKQCYDVFKMF